MDSPVMLVVAGFIAGARPQRAPVFFCVTAEEIDREW
jgi:hypothetical protein